MSSTETGMRVLVLFGAVPLFGQERANIQVLLAARSAGIDCRFITNGGWGFQAIEPELKRLGFEYRPAPYGLLIGRRASWRERWAVLRGIVGTNVVLWRELRSYRPTHLYTMNPLYVAYAFPLLFLVPQPLIYRIGDEPARHSPWHRLLWRLLRRRVTLLVANCDFVKQLCCAAGFPEKRLRRIYSCPPQPMEQRGGPDHSVRLLVQHHEEGRTISDASYLTGDPSVITFVYCGQLTSEKGVHLIAAVALRLLAEGRRLRVVLAGNYRYQNPFALALIARVREHGVDDAILFPGYVMNIPDLLTIADVHLCPSMRREALSNAVLEAKQAGVPSVVFPTGGLPESVRHGVDGWVCEDATERALEQSMRFYLDNPASLRAHGVSARRSFEDEFGPERFQREWSAVFHDTVEAGGVVAADRRLFSSP